MIKAFDSVQHDISLAKLVYDDIRGIANKWFKYYLFGRKQFVSINGHVSNKASVKYVTPRFSSWGTFVLDIYQYLNQTIKF